MITMREVVYSLYGAWRLARLDRGGLQYFDASLEGFWRSFSAAVIVAPAHVALLALHTDTGAVAGGWAKLAIVEIIAYVVAWTAWPLAMVYIARALDVSGAYLRYITAYNWAQVLGTGLYLLVAVIAAGMLAPEAGGVARFLAMVAVLFYEGFVARATLEVSVPVAAGLVVASMVLVILIRSLAGS